MSHPTVFIIAGERSGDIHASKLMYHLKKLKPTVRFIGIGGKTMESQGLQSLVPLESFSVVGFWEVFKNITFFRKTLYECERLFKSNKIDLVILVDFPGFNIRIAEIAKKNSIP
ncbi:MAG: lipid-A-disaccharide synthase, partial [Candidatus Kapaibacteriota bacterium]